MTQPLQVTCALIRRGDRILAARRADSGLWELPGGKREPGESLAQCLGREIAEELGCQVEVGPRLAVVRERDGRPAIDLHCFQCRLADGHQPRPREHRELRWVSLADFGKLPLCAADAKLLELLMEQP